MTPLALIGFSKRTMYGVYNLPKDVEIWSVNNCHWHNLPRIDRAFDIHTLEYIHLPLGLTPELRDAHVAWLQEEHEFPIYMQEAFPQFPASVPYPLADVLKLSPKKRLTSSFPYMMALAILEFITEGKHKQIYV